MADAITVTIFQNYGMDDETEKETLTFANLREAKKDLSTRGLYYHDENMWTDGELWAEVEV